MEYDNVNTKTVYQKSHSLDNIDIIPIEHTDIIMIKLNNRSLLCYPKMIK